jgi:outer membrane receptor protein involved in Fe transport
MHLPKPKFKITSFLLLLVLFSIATHAQTIRGKVIDATTGEALVGATVSLENTIFSTIVNLDGSYVFKNIPAGNYEVKVKYSGYEKSKEIKVQVKAGVAIKGINFQLKTASRDLIGVIVTATKNGETDKGARSLEQRANFVQNILSTKAIELSPDVTVANSLQRVSGVTVQRSSSGEGRYAIIRGMDQRYNSTLVNGIKIPSPDDKFRYVPLDIFPSDILERLEVIKALTPSMEADAIGGVMNLVMKSATNKKALHVFLATGESVLFKSRPFETFDHTVINKKDPAQINGSDYIATDKDFPRANLDQHKRIDPINLQAGITFSNRFLDKKLGFLITGSYQNTFRGSDQIFNEQAAQSTYRRNLTVNGIPGNNYDNSANFDDANIRQYSTQNTRVAFNNKWDYAFNKNNRISLYNLFVRLDEYQARSTVDTNIATNPGQITFNTKSRWQIQSIYNSTLQGDHQVKSNFKINWSAVFSYAKQQIPDQADYNTTNVAVNGQLQQAQNLLKGMTRIWTHNTDKDYAGYLNFIYTPKIYNTAVELSVGGLYRHKNRDNYYNSYSLSANGSTQNFTDIYNADYEFNPSGAGAPNLTTPNTYNLTEEISAGYGQFRFRAAKKLQILGGVRVEHTNQRYNTAAPKTYNLKDGKIWYTDFLPSLHLKYEINHKQSIRVSYFNSLVRPGFFEITPYYLESSTEDQYAAQGNPTLKHTTADNFDFRYELFPGASDQILAGAFYKEIHNPIETSFYNKLITGGNSGTSTAILTPQNFGDAKNYGFEFVVTKYFGMFGINANYTYTHSAITTDKNYFYYDTTLNPARGNTKVLQQTRPMQGQANHVANVSFLVKAPKIGLDMQLAFVYTGEKLALVSSYYDLDTWQSPYSQLDFSFEKKIVKHLSLYGKVNNLTNSKTRYFIKQPYVLENTLNRIPGQDDPNNSIFVQRDIYKLSFLFGLRFKL